MFDYLKESSITNLKLFSYYTLSKDNKYYFKNYLILINGLLFPISFNNIKILSKNERMLLNSVPNCIYHSIFDYVSGKSDLILESFSEFCKRRNYVYGKSKE